MLQAELYIHAQPPTANLGAGPSASARAELGGNARNDEGMVFANNIARALLPVCRQVVVGQVVAGQTPVSRDYVAFENHQGGTWTSANVNPIEHQTRRRADGVGVCELDVRELQIPVVLSFADDHSQHLRHSVLYPLNASVAVWKAGACGKLGRSQQLIDSLWKLGAEQGVVVPEYGARAPP